MLTGALIGVTVALSMMLYQFVAAKRGTGLPGQILAAMQGKEPMTLAEVAAAVGKTGFLVRGQVVQALGGLHQAGKVRTLDAPPGTPQLKKVDFIRYQLI